MSVKFAKKREKETPECVVWWGWTAHRVGSSHHSSGGESVDCGRALLVSEGWATHRASQYQPRQGPRCSPEPRHIH